MDAAVRLKPLSNSTGRATDTVARVPLCPLIRLSAGLIFSSPKPRITSNNIGRPVTTWPAIPTSAADLIAPIPRRRLLAVIQTQAFVLQHSSHATARQTASEELNSGIERAASLIQKLLLTARVSEEQFTPHFKLVDLTEFAQERISALSGIALKKNIEVELQAPPHCMAQIDRETFLFAFDNVLDNAIRYTPRNGAILVHIEISQQQIHLSILDDGVSIPAALQHRVFERFFPCARHRPTRQRFRACYCAPGHGFASRYGTACYRVKPARFMRQYAVTRLQPIKLCASIHTTKTPDAVFMSISKKKSLKMLMNTAPLPIKHALAK
jgi:hypothetical protein